MTQATAEKKVEAREVYTRLGKGKIVHDFPDGTVAVEFDHGGGHIFLPSEVRGTSPNGGRRRYEQKAVLN